MLALRNGCLGGDQAAKLRHAAPAIGAGAEGFADSIDRAASLCGGVLDGTLAHVKTDANDRSFICRSIGRPCSQKPAALADRNDVPLELRFEPVWRRQFRGRT